MDKSRDISILFRNTEIHTRINRNKMCVYVCVCMGRENEVAALFIKRFLAQFDF